MLPGVTNNGSEQFDVRDYGLEEEIREYQVYEQADEAPGDATATHCLLVAVFNHHKNPADGQTKKRNGQSKPERRSASDP